MIVHRGAVSAVRLLSRRASEATGSISSKIPNLIPTSLCSFRCSRYSSTQALRDLLSDEHYEIINEERALLGDLHGILSTLEVSRDSLDLVSDTRARIDDLFMMVVVGEFNAGKSTFINSLLGAEYLKCGVLPTTEKIYILRSAPSIISGGGAGAISGIGEHADMNDIKKHVATTTTQAGNFLLSDIEDKIVPTEWLRNVAVVDTPGTSLLLTLPVPVCACLPVPLSRHAVGVLISLTHNH